MHIRGPVPEGLEQQLVHEARDGHIRFQTGPVRFGRSDGLLQGFFHGFSVAIGTGGAGLDVFLGAADHSQPELGEGFQFRQGVEVEDVGHGHLQVAPIAAQGQDLQSAGGGFGNQGEAFRLNVDSCQVHEWHPTLLRQDLREGAGCHITKAKKDLPQENSRSFLFLQPHFQLRLSEQASADEPLTD